MPATLMNINNRREKKKPIDKIYSSVLLVFAVAVGRDSNSLAGFVAGYDKKALRLCILWQYNNVLYVLWK